MEKEIASVIEMYERYHQEKAQYVVSCGGRFEILGNHTDHNHGLCIASSCNLEIIAAIKPTGNNHIRLKSIGFPVDEIDVEDLHKLDTEVNTSKSLIKGVAFYLKEHGYKVGGFDAFTSSSIFKGAGVSSSAAFELLVGHIFNLLFNNSSIPILTLCKAGQFAENEYFGKKSGLLDQIGVGFGGIVKIDFKDIDNPKVEKIEYPFNDLHFVLVNTGGDHSSLSDLYSSIPLDMLTVANEMKQRYLADCNFDDLSSVKNEVSELQYSRAIHFFTENKRVIKAVEALEKHDEDSFLDAINESRISSTNNLKNMMVEDHYKGSPLEACDLLLKACKNKCAVKINGGGFAGSVISVIHDDDLKNVIEVMSKKYGCDNVKEIFIRENGPTTLYKL